LPTDWCAPARQHPAEPGAPDRPAGTLLAKTEMRAWDADHDIDADLLRDLLRGRVVTDPRRRGTYSCAPPESAAASTSTA
jgi:hypothetical protein